ncbi:MAG: CvpA family protein [Hyphomicrobiales bacterium]|nr:CvpA family protein [Hyphomicrobiales bacterium]
MLGFLYTYFPSYILPLLGNLLLVLAWRLPMGKTGMQISWGLATVGAVLGIVATVLLYQRYTGTPDAHKVLRDSASLIILPTLAGLLIGIVISWVHRLLKPHPLTSRPYGRFGRGLIFFLLLAIIGTMVLYGSGRKQIETLENTDTSGDDIATIYHGLIGHRSEPHLQRIAAHPNLPEDVADDILTRNPSFEVAYFTLSNAHTPCSSIYRYVNSIQNGEVIDIRHLSPATQAKLPKDVKQRSLLVYTGVRHFTEKQCARLTDQELLPAPEQTNTTMPESGESAPQKTNEEPSS